MRAVVNFAIQQLDLEKATDTFSNVPMLASSSSKEDRGAFTKDDQIAIKGRDRAHTNTELQLIWKILEATGYRIAEITGLLV